MDEKKLLVLHGIVYLSLLKCTTCVRETKLGQSNRVSANLKIKQYEVIIVDPNLAFWECSHPWAFPHTKTLGKI
jgi:hypothetical protein